MLLTVGESQYVAAMTEAKIVALDLANGKLAWEAPFGVQGRGYNAATPIVDGGGIFVKDQDSLSLLTLE